MNDTTKVLEAFRDGQPRTQLDIEEATGLKAGAVWTYIDRLRARGDLQRVVRGCRCVKHEITFLGIARLDGKDAVDADAMCREAAGIVAGARSLPNSVFALGGMR